MVLPGAMTVPVDAPPPRGTPIAECRREEAPMLKGITRAVVLVAALLPAACGDGPTAPSTIVDTEWRLASVERPGFPITANPRPDRYTLRLRADGVAGAQVSCNSCGGRYALSDDRLTVSSLACTLAFCHEFAEPASSPSSQPALLSSFPWMLEGDSVASVDGIELTLRSERGTLRFVR
jgi:heat shock protein HslJ